MELRNDLMIHYKKWVSSLDTCQKGHLAFQPRQSGSVLDSAPYKPDRQLLFTIVVWMSRGKETWERICKHLLQISRFRLVVLRSHAALCYAVNHCYVYLVTTNKRPHRRLGPKASISLGNTTQAILGPKTHAWASQGPQAWVQGTGGISSGFPGWEWK